MHGGIEIPGVELLDELGRGAHGAVYRARRGAEYYAVKVALAPSDPSAFVRFQREAIALARAKHAGLPRVLDVAKSGVPYLVMELVEGETLAARLTRGPLSEEETRALGLQLADVLAHIHRLGLVHRDVKPRNIIFDEKSGRARIVDFGIAIGTASNNFAAAEGTVPYAAPEQLRGLSIDGRADLYSLGCVLYECLCGMPPLGPLSVARLGKGDPTSDEAKLERSGASPEFVRAIVLATSQEARHRFADAHVLIESLRTAADDPKNEASGSFVRQLVGSFVGRDKELTVLQRAWSDVRNGNSRAFVIEGAMGSGKTALLQSFCDQVRAEGYAAIYVACACFDPVPFSVVRRLFDRLLERVGEQRFRQAAAGFESLLVVISPTLGRVFPEAPAVSDADDAQHVILESAAKCLHRLLQIEPASALCLDDCHWIDAGSAVILRKSLAAGGIPSLVLFAHRSASAGSAELEALIGYGADKLPVVSLGSLEEDDVARLVAGYLGADVLPSDLIDRVAALSTRTPLGTLEALRTLLEERAILPGWSGWSLHAEVAEGVHLPDSVIETLRARIVALDPIVPEVLAGAAVIGMDFDLTALPDVTGRTLDEASFAVREAYRAALVTGGAETYRFVHQAVRDALLASCTEGKLRDLNGRAAEALDRKLLTECGAGDSELVYRVADLYWRGEWRYTPRRALEVIELAARRAFEAFDNRRALLFLEHASELRTAINVVPSGEILHLNGEILVRLGRLAAGRALLEAALSRSSGALQRAAILSRIAWVCEWELDSEGGWSILRRAFQELGVEFPETSVASFARSGGAWFRRAAGFVRVIPKEQEASRNRQKILCALYQRTFRIGMLSANVPQTAQAAVLGLEAAQALGVGAALSRAYLAYSFVLTALGQRARGRQYLQRGDDVARASLDPVAIAHALQAHSVIACWEGNIAEGLEVGAKCLLEHGHWQDFNEHCHLAYNQCLLECVRGRGYEELVWVEHVLKQVELNPEAQGLFEFIELGAHALLIHLGRANEAERLLSRLRQVTVKIPKGSSHYVMSFGPRARALAETGENSAELDALDAEFQHGAHDPRRVHLAVAEYYVHLAHARVHACLRAGANERSRKQLEQAASNLRLAARIPFLKAHSLVVDGYCALLRGEDKESGSLFAEADALAIEEEVPWVRYAVARGRAHRLKARRSLDVALSEARRAEQIARENGAVFRLRWIREEFGLAQSSAVFALPLPQQSSGISGMTPITSSGTSRQTKRSRTRTGVRRALDRSLSAVERQRLVMDELLMGVAATEIHFYSVHSTGRPSWVAGRNVANQELRPAVAPEFVYEVASRKLGGLMDDTQALRSRMAVPLVERDGVQGVVYAEAPGCGAFSEEDCRLVSDLTRTILEVITGAPMTEPGIQTTGLARRSASDFARVLAEHVDQLTGEDGAPDGPILSRVAALSRLLEETKRLERYEPRLVNINDLVSKSCQRLQGIVGDRLEIISSLESTLSPVFVDPEHLELTILHCALGVRRRIAGEGELIVETANVTIEGAIEHEHMRPGLHAMITLAAVREPGPGEDSRSQLGFGDLAEQVARDMAFANGGALTLSNEPAGCASLQLFFPCATAVGEPLHDRQFAGTETVLIVDRDVAFRQEVARELKRAGYRVLVAGDTASAAAAVEIHGRVDVGVVEVTLDWQRNRASLPVIPAQFTIHTSRFPWNGLRAAGIAVPKVQFLQKPFSVQLLLGRIRSVMNGGSAIAERSVSR